MTIERRSIVIAGAVYLGSVLLVGIPTWIAGYWLISEALVLVGLEAISASPVGSGVLLLATLLVGLQLATEIAALQLGGIEALDRGSRRTALTRHVILVGGVVCLLLAAGLVGVSTAVAEPGTVPLVLGGLVALAAAVVLLRGARAVLEGYRTA